MCMYTCICKDNWTDTKNDIKANQQDSAALRYMLCEALRRCVQILARPIRDAAGGSKLAPF